MPLLIKTVQAKTIRRFLAVSASKKDCNAGHDQDRHTDIKPDQCTLLHGLSSASRRAVKAPANPAFAQESIVMTLNQMGLNLAHGIQNNADNDKQTGSPEELRRDVGHIHLMRKHLRQDRDDRQENGASKGEPRHREIEKVSRGFSGTHTGYVTSVLLQIICDLLRLELRRHPKVAEEENHSSIERVMDRPCSQRRGDLVRCRRITKHHVHN